jgi:hypothetical protein
MADKKLAKRANSDGPDADVVKIDAGTIPPAVRDATIEACERVERRRSRIQVQIKKTGPRSMKTEAADGYHPKLVNLQVADAFGTTSQGFVDQMMSDISTYFDTEDQRAIGTPFVG